VVGYEGEVRTTWLSSPSSELSHLGAIQRGNVDLACRVDGEFVVFNMSKQKCNAGHCSEYFRADHFSLYTQICKMKDQRNFEQETRFNINK